MFLPALLCRLLHHQFAACACDSLRFLQLPSMIIHILERFITLEDGKGFKDFTRDTALFDPANCESVESMQKFAGVLLAGAVWSFIQLRSEMCLVQKGA